MGRVEATGMAYERSILAANPADSREHSNICDSITNWCVALVCRPDPAGLPAASAALGRAGATGWRFVRCVSVNLVLPRSTHSGMTCQPLPRTKHGPAWPASPPIPQGLWLLRQATGRWRVSSVPRPALALTLRDRRFHFAPVIKLIVFSLQRTTLTQLQSTKARPPSTWA
jgi:hypothetical protein